MAAKNDIPIPYLRECLSYDAKTGVLLWKERPHSHFVDERAQHTWNTRWAHTEAGQIDNFGYRYIRISIDGKRRGVFAHRAAWALARDKYPQAELAHDDDNKSNNRLKNLKPATRSETHQHRRGVRGTWFNIQNGNFRASIQVAHQKTNLGTFDTEAEAHQAYIDAKKKYHTYT